MTTDTFPGLRADAAELIEKAEAVHETAYALIRAAHDGDHETVRARCRDIAATGARIATLAEAFGQTAERFVVYEEG